MSKEQDESSLKSSLGMQIAQDLPRYVWIRNEDVRVSGIPDGSLTGYHCTSFWEIKYGTPAFKSKGVQEITCGKLAAAGTCYYVLFIQHEAILRTLIVHPKWMQGAYSWKIEDFRNGPRVIEASCVGFSMPFVVDFMRKVHEG